ncbi:dihydrolipoyl dehydrogenase family protein [Palleronia rufa]|uniref:dihydrolipoyl dehydrogenase family protein n=1 Tax=Palleronia rufa TaxID=1530186 RepID=UPI00068D7730|nr:NAD(P)/FAD-dependent oxidoreductase [Palleronia rufa]
MIELPGVVRTDSGRRVEAADIMIATGAAPLVPNLPGAAGALLSDDIFHLASLPESLAIVGGGYIATEFACLLHRFGVAVTMFEVGDRLIAGFDHDVADRLERALRAQGIDIRLGTRIDAIDTTRSRATLTLDDGTTTRFDDVMLAVGRRPATSGLGLAELGVAQGADGAVEVEVDAWGEASIPGIHAIGDAAGAMMLTPVAVRDGRRCIDAIRGHRPDQPEDIVPTATFTTPECGSVGLTEAEASAAGIAFEVRSKAFSMLTAVLSNDPQDVFMKAIVARKDGRLLGIHFFGPHAGEAAQMGAVALSAGLTEAELGRTMSLHPSTSEEVIGLGDPDMPIHGPAETAEALAAE